MSDSKEDFAEGTVGATRTPLTPAQLKDIALGISRNEIFSSMQISPNDTHLLPNIFMPLMFMDDLQLKQLQADKIEHFYAPMSGAGPRSLNGYPLFMSVSMLTLDEAKEIIIILNKIENALKDI